MLIQVYARDVNAWVTRSTTTPDYMKWIDHSTLHIFLKYLFVSHVRTISRSQCFTWIPFCSWVPISYLLWLSQKDAILPNVLLLLLQLITGLVRLSRIPSQCFPNKPKYRIVGSHQQASVSRVAILSCISTRSHVTRFARGDEAHLPRSRYHHLSRSKSYRRSTVLIMKYGLRHDLPYSIEQFNITSPSIQPRHEVWFVACVPSLTLNRWPNRYMEACSNISRGQR